MKIQLGENIFEKTRFEMGVVEDYYEARARIIEAMKSNNFSKQDMNIMKEFFVASFENKFTTEDIDKNWSFDELYAYFIMVEHNINEATQNIVKKLLKK